MNKKRFIILVICLVLLGAMAIVFFTTQNKETLNALTALMAEVSSARKAEIESPTTFDDYSSYLIDDYSTKGLISDEEIAMLFSDRYLAETINYEEAAADVDLLFRTLHVCYGAYYYFGQAAYDEAEQEVMDWLSGKYIVSVYELQDIIRKSLDFMVDAHSFVCYPIDVYENVRYEYHYCSDQIYYKDSKLFRIIS